MTTRTPIDRGTDPFWVILHYISDIYRSLHEVSDLDVITADDPGVLGRRTKLLGDAREAAWAVEELVLALADERIARDEAP